MKSDAHLQQTRHEFAGDVDRTPSPQRLLIITALAVFVGEVLVMLILAVLPPLPMLVEAFADGAMLTALAAPCLYLLLFRPMRQQIQVRRRAEEELDNLNRHLKALVAERTERLTQTNRRLTHEVEEHRRTADSLRRNSDFVEKVVERAPCLILTFDAESQRCSYVNSRITDLLGYGQDELAVSEETLVNRLVETRDRASFREVVNELVNGPEGQAVGGGCGFIASSGRVVPLRFGMTVLSRTPTMEAKDLLLTALPASV
jgi:PAS domain-containing protein